ncbi:MAG: SCO family protein [Gammaproteobacteria bacterium]
MKTISTGLIATALLVLMLTSDIYAHELEPIDPHAQHKMAATAVKVAMAEIELPDNLPMINQFGDQVDLRKDVIGNRIVAINFVYTTCTTVCPVVSAIFSMVQDQLAGFSDREIALITVTVDPTRDTPHRLLSYSKNFNPGTGWSWLTGDKKTVDKALRAMGAYTPNFEDHPAMVLIGDDSKSEWFRFYGFPAPEAIESKLRELLSNRSS